MANLLILTKTISKKKKMKNKILITIAAVFFVVPLLSFAFAYLFYLVWNNILVDVVTVFNPITYWKSYLLWLALMFPYGLTTSMRKSDE